MEKSRTGLFNFNFLLTMTSLLSIGHHGQTESSKSCGNTGSSKSRSQIAQTSVKTGTSIEYAEQEDLKMVSRFLFNYAMSNMGFPLIINSHRPRPQSLQTLSLRSLGTIQTSTMRPAWPAHGTNQYWNFRTPFSMVPWTSSIEL